MGNEKPGRSREGKNCLRKRRSLIGKENPRFLLSKRKLEGKRGECRISLSGAEKR